MVTTPCPMCHGPSHSMGHLGNLEHFRCQWCSWTFYRGPETLITVSPPIKPPKVVSCPQCGKNVRFTEFDLHRLENHK